MKLTASFSLFGNLLGTALKLDADQLLFFWRGMLCTVRRTLHTRGQTATLLVPTRRGGRTLGSTIRQQRVVVVTVAVAERVRVLAMLGETPLLVATATILAFWGATHSEALSDNRCWAHLLGR